MVTRIRTGALSGIEGLAVRVEVDLSRGLPGFHLVGLPNAEVRESRERVLAALRHSGERIPPGKITVNLAPAGVRKQGASFDLAIALGVVAAARDGDDCRSTGARDRALFLGELSLFGELRPVRGLLAIVLAAAQAGTRTVVVPAGQAWEARLVAGLQVIGAGSLAEVIRWWRTGREPPRGAAAPAAGLPPAGDRAEPAALLAALSGLPLARKAAVLAAVGRHHLLLVGPPGSGKTRLAGILDRLQPDLTPAEGLEVTRIHSAAGTLGAGSLLTRRPFRAPHHTVTRAGLVGGGNSLRPGEATLAHRGILFLDELAEFSPAVLDVLRQPLQEGVVSVVRGAGRRCYPAAFQLIGAMNPCRCGYRGSRQRQCRCTPGDRARYLGRLSGPLLDRFDLWVEMGPWQGRLPLGEGGARPRAEPAGDWRAQPTAAQLQEARARLAAGGGGLGANGLEPAAAAYLEEIQGPLGLSLRAVVKTVAVARTVAALDGRERVGRPDLAEALEFRRPDPPWEGE